MKRSNSLAVVLLTVLFIGSSACSQKNDSLKQDRIINVEDDDKEMNAAIANARSTLPQFWQVFEKPERGEEHFALKVAITDKNGTEHFWATEIERKDGKTMGTINNEPDIVENVKLGTRLEIPEADISDWMYMRNKKMVGNYTIVPLFKQMSPAEVAQFKAMMEEP
jgi:uncharacterized protein YegJ (DUF2314 family)